MRQAEVDYPWRRGEAIRMCCGPAYWCIEVRTDDAEILRPIESTEATGDFLFNFQHTVGLNTFNNSVNESLNWSGPVSSTTVCFFIAVYLPGTDLIVCWQLINEVYRYFSTAQTPDLVITLCNKQPVTNRLPASHRYDFVDDLAIPLDILQ